MTIYRFRAAALGLAVLLESSCNEQSIPRDLPHTNIGRIMRLGGGIDAELKHYLLSLPDQKIRRLELASSSFSTSQSHDRCSSWYFDEPENKAIRNSWQALGYYTLYVSVDLCGDEVKVSTAYRGL